MSDKKLVSLSEHNAQRMQERGEMHRLMQPHPNGIACPRCGVELWDSNPSITLTSNPAQKNVHCPACGHHGYRIA